jgi:4-alpha-glucanotransferase
MPLSFDHSYDWEAMEREGFAWWKRRLIVMANYYHAYL